MKQIEITMPAILLVAILLVKEPRPSSRVFRKNCRAGGAFDKDCLLCLATSTHSSESESSILRTSTLTTARKNVRWKKKSNIKAMAAKVQNAETPEATLDSIHRIMSICVAVARERCPTSLRAVATRWIVGCSGG